MTRHPRTFVAISLCLLWPLCAGLFNLPLHGIAIADAAEDKAQPGLAIIEAGIESSEDAPFIPASYAFMPGEYLYFTFEVTGFKLSAGEYNAPRQMSLAYRVDVVDTAGKPLASAISGKIEEEIGREDKDWLPKRRAAFLLPPYVASGTYHLRVSVDDTIAKSQTTREFPFRMGGHTINPVGGLSIQNFRFLRDDQDGAGLTVPDYRPGDTVWARFDMAGFKTDTASSVHLQYGLSVLRPDGKILFEQKAAADEKLTGLFYPPQFVPGTVSVSTTKDLARGEYTMVIHLIDVFGKQDAEFQQKFRIE
jgi:hypothetical protein